MQEMGCRAGKEDVGRLVRRSLTKFRPLITVACTRGVAMEWAILEIELTGPVGKKGRVGRQRLKDDSWLLGLSKWVNGSAMYWDGKTRRGLDLRWGRVGGDQRLCFDHIRFISPDEDVKWAVRYMSLELFERSGLKISIWASTWKW